MKRTRLIKITPIFAVMYLATYVLWVNIALRNLMPFGIEVDLKGTKVFQQMIQNGFMYASLYAMYDFKITIFVYTPLFLAGATF